ncbi:MAG: GHKL domain-containing protein [Cyanomargarita calcarea GSE-NOS-MK-12-04C]|jgi:signal transduction histidine kinase|uniref:histidine kinase n=1 Tax=Cyanomargarita calcarea GSE-NOS-MK-12-04C TaxID=2839659 RepID=A0A951QLP7_9CYAN|nr:GHKL domain-containing protein [Cyanomargarita calcarea GSE-NOS-MK-12-04C]
MVPLNIGQWFGKLKVGQKISLGYGMMLGVAIAGTTVGIVLTQYYQRQADAIEKDVLEEFKLTNRLQNSLLQTRVHTWELISLKMASEDFKEVYNHFLEHHSDFKEGWLDFKESEGATKGEEEQETPGEVEKVKEFTKKYQDVIDTYIKEIDILSRQVNASNFKPEDIENIKLKLIQLNKNDLLAKVDSFSDNLIELEHIIKKEYDQVNIVINTLKTLQLKIVAGVLCISGIIATILAIATTKTIAHPIQNLTKISQRAIQESNFDLQATVETRDEVGLLATSFNQLLYSVKNLLKHQQETKEKLESYNQTLEQRVDERTHELNGKNIYLKQLLEELHQTQIQMLQSEKMSALGQMVAGIAHEVNNPVNFIHANLNHLEEYSQNLIQVTQLYQQYYPNLPEDIQQNIEDIDLDFIIEDLSKVIKSMTVGTTRIRDIVKSLRNFSRLDEAEFKKVDLHEGIDGTLMILNHRLKAQTDRTAIEIIKEYGQLPLVECYPGQLNQVFMNLLSNAIDALNGLTVNHPEGKTPTITIHSQVTSENRVLISIADNGSGVPEDIRSKLFNPFFTTKSVGKGTGLGLSISYQIIVEKHGGKIWCDSTFGQGTKFMIEIPVHPIVII